MIKKNKNVFKSFIFLTSFLALAFIFSGSALAATATLGVGTATGNPGDAVVVPINLNVDTNGITSLVSFDVAYKSASGTTAGCENKIKFPDASDPVYDDRILYGSALANPANFFNLAEEDTPGVVSVALIDKTLICGPSNAPTQCTNPNDPNDHEPAHDPTSHPKGLVVNGEILKLQFRLLGGATAGDCALVISNVGVRDNSSNSLEIPASGTNGKITVGGGPVTYGIADFIALVPNWLQTFPSPYPASDINKDGNVNSLDLGIIMSNWGLPQ